MGKKILTRFGTAPPTDVYKNSVIVCDGNSLTFGLNITLPYPFQLNQRAPFKTNGTVVTNKGISGQTTQQMVSDVTTDIDPLYNSTVKSILIAWEVGNDIYYNGNATNAYTAIAAYCNARRAIGWKVIAITCTPRDNATTSFGDTSAQYEVKLQAANALMLANAASFCDAIIDTRSDARLATITDQYWNADHVHLNNTGYSILVDLIMPKIITL